MKKLKLFFLLLSLILVGAGLTSCVVSQHEAHRDNGRHLGWSKKSKKQTKKMYVIKSDKQKSPAKIKKQRNNKSNAR
jgi:hypothetical protein